MVENPQLMSCVQVELRAERHHKRVKIHREHTAEIARDGAVLLGGGRGAERSGARARAASRDRGPVKAQACGSVMNNRTRPNT